MPKNRHPLAAFVPLIAFTTLACPTRPAPGADGAGGARIGGQSGSLGTDASAGAGPVGRGGTAGTADSGAGGSAGAAGAGSPGGTTGEAGHAQAGTGGAVGGSGGAAGGGCSSACGLSATCVGSTCLLNDGQQCSLASQCVSGKCSPFYQDVDGDGYGTGPATGFCGTVAPVGYAALTGDCCDNAPNLFLATLIHPNAGFQTGPAGVCGVTWDYNCDSVVETSLSNSGCDSDAIYPSCTSTFVNYPESECGTIQTNLGCFGEMVSNPTGPGTMNVCVGIGGGPEMLGCR